MTGHRNSSELEAGRVLFSQSCTFLRGVTTLQALPAATLPEVAFAGRSNVGKSSLLNALVQRKALARTSNTPGRTREINYFNLADRLYLVDLPGYGYARVSKTQARRWGALVMEYLKGRASLRRVCLLIDARRGVMAADEAVMSLLDDAAVSYQVVATKGDKVKPAAREAVLSGMHRALRAHVAAHPEVLWTSSVSGEGVADLRAELAALVA